MIDRLNPDELRDLEGSWRTAESTRRGRALIIDIRRLTAIEEHTLALLDRLRGAGAQILGGNGTRDPDRSPHRR